MCYLRLTFAFIASLATLPCLYAETIEEKIASFAMYEEESGGRPVSSVNQTLFQLRKELESRYREVEELVARNASEDEFLTLLEEVNALKEELFEAEDKWRESEAGEILLEGDPAGILPQEDVTLSQLIMEMGASNYLYVIPQELFAMKIHMQSSLMVPKESWPHLLEAILKHSGVGIKTINSYTRQLYLLKQDLTAFACVVTELYQLESFDPKARVAFIYSPKVENLKAAFYFLERFRDQKTAFVYQVGTRIAIIGFQDEVKKLIALAEAVWPGADDKVTKVVPTTKIAPDEVVKILKNYFNGLSDGRSMASMKGGNELSVLPLHGTGVVLIGPQQIVSRAEEIIRDTESQVEDPYELTVFWYSCSHSNPSDLAEILREVYASLICSTIEGQGRNDNDPLYDSPYGGEIHPPPPQPPMPHMEGGVPYPPPPPIPYQDMTRPYGGFGMERGSKESSTQQKNAGSFIPYSAAGKLLMVVRKDTLPKIKEVVKRLDVPKRMVEIEVLLCERRLTNSTRSGINLLKLGSHASAQKTGGVTYDRSDEVRTKGIFEFFFSRPSTSSLPAFDVSYNFLLSQDDVRVMASPSVLAINQTPATIAITDQISINNGASPVDTSSGSIVFKESYDRADFGITITLTPTVHEPELDNPDGQLYITLDNDISFEDIKGEARSHDRPDVHKRRIKNQVRILDGETVILGGLRSKSAEDKNEKIPFLGELPGIGKLFGTTVLNDKSNEMFIFIRPRVIHDPKQDLIRLREEKLRMRPGDKALLLEKIKESREGREKRRFARSLELLFSKNGDETLVE